MRKIKPIVKAWIALGLDIIAFIITSLLTVATSNMLLILIYAVLLYVLAYDAFQASVYITRYFKK